MHPIRLITLALASTNAVVSGLVVTKSADADVDVEAPELSAAYALAKRDCFGWGVSWGDEDDKKEARQKARSACKALSGNWAAKESKSKCYSLKRGGKVNFNVKRLENSPGKLSSKDCEWSLIREINNCGFGGESKKNGFNFMSDPNWGWC